MYFDCLCSVSLLHVPWVGLQSVVLAFPGCIYLPYVFMNRTEWMVYLKIPVGNNAHEDTQHDIIYKHDRRQCDLSRKC